ARYIRESGLTNGELCGLVDCGWSGTWTDILADIVVAEGGTCPGIFFLGRRSSKSGSRAPTFSHFFVGQGRTGPPATCDYFHIVIEFFLTANHGRTTSFAEQGRKLVPVLACTDLQGFSPAEWSAFRCALIRFAELYAERPLSERSTQDLRKALVDSISL